MRKLTRDEAMNIKAKPEGRSNYLRGVLLNMEVGEIVLIEPDDWTQRYRKPSTYCLELARKTGRVWKSVTALDGSGWVIERVK